MIPDTPCLILMDELMNYISRNRKNGLATQLYNFLQNLSETVRGKTRAVLAISIPSSMEMEMNAEDVGDYKEGYEGAHRDSLLALGTAPLDESTFRTACFEQLGERNLETAVTTDIAGSAGAHAMRLDEEATEAIKKARLHRKVAATIFFESNGGQGNDRREATAPEIRLAVGDPEIDIGNVETTLDALTTACYCFSLRENLNKRFAYVGKRGDGHYQPFNFEQSLSSLDVEIAEDTFIITREAAVAYRAKVKAEAEGKTLPGLVPELPQIAGVTYGRDREAHI